MQSLTDKQKEKLINLLKNTEQELADNLNMFTNKNFVVSMRNADFKPISDILAMFNESGESMITAVLLLALVGIKGDMLLLFPEKSAIQFVKIILEREDDEFNCWDDLEVSTLCETTNIFGTSFANKLGEQINLTITTTKPHFTVNYFSAIMQELVMEYAQFGDKILAIDMEFRENELDFSGYFFFMPSPESLRILVGD